MGAEDVAVDGKSSQELKYSFVCWVDLELCKSLFFVF